MRPLARPIVVGLVIALTACTGGGADDSEAGETADPSLRPDLPTALTSTVERIVPADGSALIAGPGDEQLHIASVASDDDEILAAGSRSGDDGARLGPVLLSTTDGREWADVELPAELDGGALAAVVPAGDGFLAVGNQAEGGAPMAVRQTGNGDVEPVELVFPDLSGDAQPFQVRAAATAGDRVFVVGVAVEAATEAPQDAVATLAVVASSDAGDSWSPIELPDDLRVVDTGAALLELTHAGGQVGEIELGEHDGALVLAVSVAGADGVATTVWRSDEAGAEWTSLGTAADLFGGQSLDLLHGHGAALLAFTSADGDTTGWRSDDGGGTFTPLDTDPSVFGGGGRQSADAAVTLESGALLVAGVTEGEPRGGRRPGELELWLSQDLESWQRDIGAAGLAGAGHQQAAGVVTLGDEIVVVGADQRAPTAEEVEAFDAADGAVSAADRSLATHAATWVVSLEAVDAAGPALEVAELEVTGFDGDVTISGLVPYPEGVIAAGWVSSDDESTPAVWTSPDGVAWTRGDAPALSASGGRIHALTATDDGIVAIGQTTIGDSHRLGVWTSTDGVTWAAADLTDPAFESAVGYGVSQAGAELIAVGTSGPDGREYRDVGIWRSSDGGLSWSVVPTTEEPFQARDVEVLAGVGVRADGTIVAVGHTGDAEDHEEGGFQYTPEPYAVESADGTSWTALPGPFGEAKFGELYAVVPADDAFVALGMAAVPAAPEQLPGGDLRLAVNGVARRTEGEWSVSDQRFRHRPSVRGWVDSPVGTVLVGGWYRNGGGTDALIAVERDGELDAVTDVLLAEGEQRAVAAATLGDRIVVLGLDTTADEPVVIGWSVAAG